MPDTNNENLVNTKNASSQMTLGLPQSPDGVSVEDRVRTARLKLRDKALPNRLVIASLVCDSVVIAYALIFSFWFRFQTSIQEYGVPAELTLRDYAGYIAFGTIALVFSLTNSALYERHALLRFRFVSLQIFKASTLWSLGFLGIALIFKFQPSISRIFVALAAVGTKRRND